MSFLFPYAFAIAGFIFLPFIAHRIQQRFKTKISFAATKFLRNNPSIETKRSHIQDIFLLMVRICILVSITLLATSMMVRCNSQAGFQRKKGASIACVILLDDSYSMQLRDPTNPKKSKWDRSLEYAEQIVSQIREGDNISIILAGYPSRVLVPPTGSKSLLHEALRNNSVTDRGTDLDTALSLAYQTLEKISHFDQRLIILSDFFDGKTDKLFELNPKVEVQVPFPEFSKVNSFDCAITNATKSQLRLMVKYLCTKPFVASDPPSKIEIQILNSESKKIHQVQLDLNQAGGDFQIQLPPETPNEFTVNAQFHDDVIENNERFVFSEELSLQVGYVAKSETSYPFDTGSILSSAILSIRPSARIHQFESIPQNAEDLKPFHLVISSNLPGFLPEIRDTLNQWIQSGGVFVHSLGPDSASPPIGYHFEPYISKVFWKTGEDMDIYPTHSVSSLNFSNLKELHAKGRGIFQSNGVELISWKDLKHLEVVEHVGRGDVFILGLPIDPFFSDLPFRGGFLAMVKEWVETSEAKGRSFQADVGTTKLIRSEMNIKVEVLEPSLKGMKKIFEGKNTENGWMITPNRSGTYLIKGENRTYHMKSPFLEEEFHLQPRRMILNPKNSSSEDFIFWKEASPLILILLCGLFFLEFLIRVVHYRDEKKQ